MRKAFTVGILFMASIYFNQIHAVRTNGVNNDKEYIELGQKEYLSAVGYITVPRGLETLCATATLIDNTGLCITAAHTFKRHILEYINNKPDRNCDPFVSIPLADIYMGFDQDRNLSQLYPVTSVVINSFYINNLKNNITGKASNGFDIAIITLQAIPANIHPIPLLKVSWNNLTSDMQKGMFAGYGEGDNNKSCRRAAYVPYIIAPGSHYGPASEDEIRVPFFKPDEPKSLKYDPVIMSQHAWINHDRCIYGHGEPGDSGGPLIIMTSQGPKIIGILRGGGVISFDKDYDPEQFNNKDFFNQQSKEKFYNKLATCFSPTIVNHKRCGMNIDIVIEKMVNYASGQPTEWGDVTFILMKKD